MSDAWGSALRFAALPGAASVEFSRVHQIEDGTPTTRFKLRSIAASGQVIGDDRDYDLLKAAISPLERLADIEGPQDFTVSLDLVTGKIERSPHR